MNGIGPVIRCMSCDYVLHMGCRYPSDNLTPSFLPSNTFKFMQDPPPRKIQCPKPNCREKHNRYCDACGKATHGFVYHCYKSDFDLHPCCAVLTTRFSIEGVDFRLNKESKPKNCDWCKSKIVQGNDGEIPGWFYESENKEYNYHVFCIMDMAVQSCATTTSGGGGTDLALENLELPSEVVKRRSGKNGDKYWRILKILITTVLSIVFGDPTTILAKLAVETVVQLLTM